MRGICILGVLLWGALACRTSVDFNAEGLFCDDQHPCAPGLACVNKACTRPAATDDCRPTGLCASPPEARCENGQTLVTYPQATCNLEDGSCFQDEVRRFCENGCADGRCVGTGCVDERDCNLLPETLCAGSTQRTYPGPGTCSEGACVHQEFTDLPCEFGCSDGACLMNP